MTKVDRILGVMGAFALDPYFYPIYRLRNPDLMWVPYFVRKTQEETIFDYVDFTKNNIVKLAERNGPFTIVAHSSGAVATWGALATLCQEEHPARDLVQGVILLNPANIGPGNSRIANWNVKKINHYGVQFLDELVDRNRKKRKRIIKKLKKLGTIKPMFRDIFNESQQLIKDVLSGELSSESTFPRDKVVLLKGTQDRLITPNMTDDTINNLGKIIVIEKGISHSTPLRDIDASILRKCGKAIGLILPR